jgi:hypothetical protein
VSPHVSTLDLVTGTHVILTADGELGALAGRAADAAGLPATVLRLEQPLMRRLGAELLIVRPDQVVAAAWPAPSPDHPDHAVHLDHSVHPDHAIHPDHAVHPDHAIRPVHQGEIDFLDTTMAMLCGRPRS